MRIMLAIVFMAALGVAYAAYGFVKVKVLPEGSSQMSEMAKAIRTGANTFLLNEYKVLVPVVILIAFVFGIFISVSGAVAFLIGVTMSALAAFGIFMENLKIFKEIVYIKTELRYNIGVGE